MAALIEADTLHKAIQSQGSNSIWGVLEYYEKTLAPTRDEANDALNLMVKQNGGNLAVAYKSFCPSPDTELFELYRKFYSYFYKRRTEEKGS